VEGQIPWSDWVEAILEAATELKEDGFVMEKDPSEDNEVLQNIIAISAAEWRDGDKVNEDGPSMGRSYQEESYSPVQVYMPVWGKDTTESGDVTLINNEFVEEFQNIDRDELIKLISTDIDLAAKAAVILLQNKRGYDIWSTWSIVQDEPQYKEFAKQFTTDYVNVKLPDDGDPDRGIPAPNPSFVPDSPSLSSEPKKDNSEINLVWTKLYDDLSNSFINNPRTKREQELFKRNPMYYSKPEAEDKTEKVVYDSEEKQKLHDIYANMLKALSESLMR
jgi:hypothetical protein